MTFCEKLFIIPFCVQERIGADCIDNVGVKNRFVLLICSFLECTLQLSIWEEYLELKKSLIWGSVYKLVLR